MKDYKSITILLCLFVIGTVHSQSFIEPVENVGNLWFPKQHKCVITKMDGTEIKGQLTSGKGVGSSPKSLTVKLENDEKIQIEADDIQSMVVEASDIIKFSQAVDATSNIEKTAKSNWKDIIDSEHLYYERALAPKKKKDVYRLYLLMNPGFDSKIKVYHDPWGNEGETSIGGISAFGGDEKSYLFVKDGNKSFKVKKKEYKKLFSELYGDCQIMMDEFGGKKNKFKDLAGHVFVYDQACE